MSGTRVRAVGLSLVLLAGGPAFGQATEGAGFAGTPGAPGGMNLILILMAPAVQQELKLSDPQKTQVFDLARDASRKGREVYRAALQGGGAQAFMAAAMRLRQENEQAAAQVLDGTQKARAEQIMLQVEGPLAVVRPEIAARINLNQAQTRHVQMTMMQFMMAQRELSRGDGGGPGSGTNRLRDAAGQQIGRVLDAKQKSAFNKMLGEPFDVSKIDPALARPAADAPPSTGADKPPTKAEKSRARRKKAAGKGPTAKGDDAADKPKAP